MSVRTAETSSPAPGSHLNGDLSPGEKGVGSASNAVVPEDVFEPDWRFVMIFITISVVTLAAALDATSLSVALPIISKDLNGTAIEAFWSGTSFLLTSTVFQPIFASMSHIFGRKLAMYTALVSFTIGTILAAVSHNFALLLVGRSLQGVGGGGLIVISEILITDLVPLRQRGKWFSFINAMWAVGSVTGPLLGGGFSENITWRWIFWFNLPLIAIAAVLVTIFLKLNFVPGTLVEKLGRVDWLGAILFTASATSFLIATTWGGVMFAWDSWHTLVPLILGIVGMLSFILYERYIAVEPIVPLSIFANTTLIITYFNTICQGAILWSLLYYMPLYYEAVKGYTPIIAGVAVFPETFTTAPAAIAVGVSVSITGRYRWAIWLGWALTILGMGLLCLLDPDTTIVQWIFLNIIAGLGTGVLFPSLSYAIQGAIDNKDVSFGQAFYSFFRAFGQAIGIAIGGTIFQNTIRSKISSYDLLAPFVDEYSQDATALVIIIQTMEEGLAKMQLIQAYSDSLRIIWVVMCVLAGVAGLTSMLTKEFTLDRRLNTKQGLRKELNSGDAEAREQGPVQEVKA